MRKPAWEMYNGQIYDMRQQGQSLQKIGDTIGRTRERVRQILVEKYGTAEIKSDSLFTRKEVAFLTNLHEVTISLLTRKGVIKRVGCGLWGIDALKTLLERSKCKICGGFLPKRRFSYCSDECAKKGWDIIAKRVRWRRLHQKMGKALPPSCAYIYPKKSPYYSGGNQ